MNAHPFMRHGGKRLSGTRSEFLGRPTRAARVAQPVGAGCATRRRNSVAANSLRRTRGLTSLFETAQDSRDIRAGRPRPRKRKQSDDMSVVLNGIAGSVASDGLPIPAPAEWVNDFDSEAANGVVTVTFTTAFTNPPSVTVTPTGAYIEPSDLLPVFCYPLVGALTTESFEVGFFYTAQAADEPINGVPFNFIAVEIPLTRTAFIRPGEGEPRVM